MDLSSDARLRARLPKQGDGSPASNSRPGSQFTPSRALLSVCDVRRLLAKRLERTPTLAVGEVHAGPGGTIRAMVIDLSGKVVLSIDVDGRTGAVLGWH